LFQRESELLEVSPALLPVTLREEFTEVEKANAGSIEFFHRSWSIWARQQEESKFGFCG